MTVCEGVCWFVHILVFWRLCIQSLENVLSYMSGTSLRKFCLFTESIMGPQSYYYYYY